MAVAQAVALIWETLVGCLWLVVLMFRFLNLEAFVGSGFGLLMLASKELEPPPSNVLPI